MLLELFIASVAIMAISLIGIVTLFKQAGELIEHNLDYLVSFAAGVFAVLFFTLAGEVIKHASSPLYGFGWIIAGVALTFIIVQLFPEGHYHADGEKEPISIQRLIIGDSFHNIGDGILLAVAFTTNPILGIVTSMSVVFHELVQEVSEFFVLRRAGYTPTKALQINFFTASTILIGSLGGYFLLETFTSLEIPVLGIATGALFTLLVQDLIPHSLKYARQCGCTTNHLFAIMVGAVLMIAVFVSTASIHSHENVLHREHHEEHGGHDEH